MPPLGTVVSDREALTVIERWIQSVKAVALGGAVAMTAGHADILPEATLRAFREAAAAAKPGEARTWLPATTPCAGHRLQVLGRRLWFAGLRAYRLRQRCCQARSLPEQFRSREVAVPVAVHGQRG